MSATLCAEQLNFIPGVVVPYTISQTRNVSIEIDTIDETNTPIHGKGMVEDNATIELDITLVDLENQSFDVVIKKVMFSQTNNGVTVNYNSTLPIFNKGRLGKLIKSILNIPLHFSLDEEGGYLEDSGRLFNFLESLDSLDLVVADGTLLAFDNFETLFSCLLDLNQSEFQEGQMLTESLAADEEDVFENTYEIKRINEIDIEASLTSTFNFQYNDEEDVVFSISGDVLGEVLWNRSNAMVQQRHLDITLNEKASELDTNISTHLHIIWDAKAKQ